MKTKLTRTLTATALSILVAALPAACNDKEPPKPNPPASTGSSPAASASPSAPAAASGHVVNNGPSYKMPAEACKLLTVEPFADLYPGAKTRLDPLGPGKCNITIGELPGGLIISTTVEIVRGGRGAATGQFEGLRSIEERDNPGKVKNFAGVGSAAYTYDGMLGPVLVVVHGDAYVRVVVAKLGRSAVIPPDTADRAAKIARQILAGLPAA
ncbi:MAG TPA: hypothetical protein DGT23_23965 [Micromonosporaceae bacterium]|nr:hypothetical protein [Micromonosporaceae bacterium]